MFLAATIQNSPIKNQSNSFKYRQQIYKKIQECVLFVRRLDSLRISLVLLGDLWGTTTDPLRAPARPGGSQRNLGDDILLGDVKVGLMFLMSGQAMPSSICPFRIQQWAHLEWVFLSQAALEGFSKQAQRIPTGKKSRWKYIYIYIYIYFAGGFPFTGGLFYCQ